jgi:hypothetical protein
MLLAETAAAVAAREGERHVASIVFYGPYQEWGTRKLPARPHWRPAAREIRARGISTRHLAARTAGGRFTWANTPGEIVLQTFGRDPVKDIVAGQLTRAVRKWIRIKDVIDTTNYLLSIAEGDTAQEALEKSRSRLLDPSTATGAV